MAVFFVWIALIAIILTGYSLLLWRRAQKRSRFQARLAILFFLFVLIPTIPITLFFSVILTKSTEILFLPGVKQALSESLDVMRILLNDRKEQFLKHHPDLHAMGNEQCAAEGLGYLGEITWQNSQPHINFSYVEPSFQKSVDSVLSIQRIDNQNKKMESRQYNFYDIYYSSKYRTVSKQQHDILLTELIRPIRAGSQNDAFISYETKFIYEAYHIDADSIIYIIGFSIPHDIFLSRQDILSAKRNNETLSYIRDTFIKQGMIWATSVFFIIILAIISVYSAKLISQGISEPIRQLTAGMEKIGAGDLNHRVHIKARDELEYLVNSFNNMVDELSANRENLKRAERAAAWRDIARQISHEIKNPLTPIQLSLYRLKASLPEEYQQNSDFKESFRTIEEELASMKKLAEEFSEFARMPHLQLKEENINEIITSTVRLFEGEATQLSVRLDMQDNIPLLQLDRQQFRRALINLLKNAMEASNPGDTVEIHVSKFSSGNYQIQIEVTDHGIGMDAEVREQAFSPYFTTKEKGSGLGLFIVKRIITDHGGEVELRSERNKGTTVIISL